MPKTQKKCPKAKVLNSKTNRCVKKQCPTGKVLMLLVVRKI